VFRNDIEPGDVVEYHWATIARGDPFVRKKEEDDIHVAKFRLIEAFASCVLGAVADDTNEEAYRRLKGLPWKLSSHSNDVIKFPWRGADGHNPLREGILHYAKMLPQDAEKIARQRAKELGVYACGICGRKFDGARGLREHTLRHNKDTAEYKALAKEKCERAKRAYANKDPLPCPIEGCDETRSSPRNLQIHIEADHKGDSSMRDNAAAKYRESAKEARDTKKFICPFTGCWYHDHGFSNAQDMKNHIANLHSPETVAEQEKTYKGRWVCPYVKTGCIAKGFERPIKFRGHMEKYHNETISAEDAYNYKVV
jgi:hypothetical protein